MDWFNLWYLPIFGRAKRNVPITHRSILFDIDAEVHIIQGDMTQEMQWMKNHVVLAHFLLFNGLTGCCESLCLSFKDNIGSASNYFNNLYSNLNGL